MRGERLLLSGIPRPQRDPWTTEGRCCASAGIAIARTRAKAAVGGGRAWDRTYLDAPQSLMMSRSALIGFTTAPVFVTPYGGKAIGGGGHVRGRGEGRVLLLSTDT